MTAHNVFLMLGGTLCTHLPIHHTTIPRHQRCMCAMILQRAPTGQNDCTRNSLWRDHNTHARCDTPPATLSTAPAPPMLTGQHAHPSLDSATAPGLSAHQQTHPPPATTPETVIFPSVLSLVSSTDRAQPCSNTGGSKFWDIQTFMGRTRKRCYMLGVWVR